MAKGVSRLYTNSIKNCYTKCCSSSEKCLKPGIVISNGSRRWVSTHITRRLLQKEAVAEKAVQGKPYTKLTIGVPKELWKDEKRYNFEHSVQ